MLLLGPDLHSRGDVERLTLPKHTNPCTRGALKSRILATHLLSIVYNLGCVSPLQVCVFTAPLFSAFCALTTYFLAKEVRNQGAGLFAALFAASVPSYISRSVAGSYDNEGVAIFALVLVFFLYVKVGHHDVQLKSQLQLLHMSTSSQRALGSLQQMLVAQYFHQLYAV